jgi:hypothetical protein
VRACFNDECLGTVILTSALTSLLCMNGVAWIRVTIDLQDRRHGLGKSLPSYPGNFAKYDAIEFSLPSVLGYRPLSVFLVTQTICQPYGGRRAK